MNIKITNTIDAKMDAETIVNSADFFSSMLSTLHTIQTSINNSWSDCSSKNTIISEFEKGKNAYKDQIIPALERLGVAINAYAIATEQLATSGKKSSSGASYSSPSEYADKHATSGYSSNYTTGVYRSNPALGFNVTTNNRTYSLPANEFDEFCSIVAAESDKSYDDSLAVATTILNRCESPEWSWAGGSNPIKQAKYPGQFVVVEHGLNKQYLNGNYPDVVRKAVSDALSGVRNHDYLSFRSNESYSYSNNMITSSGNRYK